MVCVRRFLAAALTAATFVGAGCARSSSPDAVRRQTIARYSLWDGMGPPRSDPQFSRFECAGSLTISNVDVSFVGTSPACALSMHHGTAGTLAYSDVREIRVTSRPELLIFSTHRQPPAVRVTDWDGAADFQRAVSDLQNAYGSWKARTGRSRRK